MEVGTIEQNSTIEADGLNLWIIIFRSTELSPNYTPLVLSKYDYSIYNYTFETAKPTLGKWFKDTLIAMSLNTKLFNRQKRPVLPETGIIPYR